MRQLLFLFSFVSVIAKAQPLPSSQELASAQAYIKQAQELTQSGDCKRAIGGLEAAYQISRDPLILPMLAHCYRAESKLKDALRVSCWYQSTPLAPAEEEMTTEQVEFLSRRVGASCRELPSAEGAAPPPALEVEAPPKLRRFLWPTSFALTGGAFMAKTIRSEDPYNPSIGADLAFSAMALSLYSVADKSKLYPSFWVNTDGTLYANIYLSMPQASVSLTLNTQPDGGFLLLDIAKKR